MFVTRDKLSHNKKGVLAIIEDFKKNEEICKKCLSLVQAMTGLEDSGNTKFFCDVKPFGEATSADEIAMKTHLPY